MKINKQVCYRLRGHNEGDEPSFTQPLMYKKIQAQKRTMNKYADHLIGNGTVSKEFYDAELKSYHNICEEAYIKANKIEKVRNRDWLDSPWLNFYPDDIESIVDVPPTAIAEDVVDHIAKVFSSVKDDFVVHRGRLSSNHNFMH